MNMHIACKRVGTQQQTYVKQDVDYEDAFIREGNSCNYTKASLDLE